MVSPSRRMTWRMDRCTRLRALAGAAVSVSDRGPSPNLRAGTPFVLAGMIATPHLSDDERCVK